MIGFKELSTAVLQDFHVYSDKILYCDWLIRDTNLRYCLQNNYMFYYF